MKGAKQATRAFVERLLWALLYRVKPLPWGLDFRQDLARRAPDVRIGTVFDIGANVGQSALDFSRTFPHATIWSFEPFEEPFRELERVTAGKRVRCFKLAFGSEAGTVSIAPDRQSTDSSLLAGTQPASDDRREDLEVTTLDRFTEEHAIAHIDLLKVDTEGFDLEVLKGAERCLRSHAVSFVEVEAGMNPENRKHVPFELLKSFLEERGYVLFAVYEQVPEWTGEARLRFANPVFVAEDVASSRALEQVHS
jgi:FkbM family methyltransferase